MLAAGAVELRTGRGFLQPCVLAQDPTVQPPHEAPRPQAGRSRRDDTTELFTAGHAL